MITRRRRLWRWDGGCAPTSYYAADGPLSSVFAARPVTGSVVAIGLGTGAVACYAEPGERWRFVEINPDVIDVARAHFTYLENAPTDDLTLSLGDGRRALATERGVSLLLVDAFNSDSVPIHLLTREALREYVRVLAPGGWIALHLSNRVLDLTRVVADVAAAEKFRQVLDAYMTELSYGNTIEAYTDTIEAEGGEREVNVLRLGRIGLFYQTADRVHTGRWNAEAGRWEALGADFRNGIYQAIRIANKLTAPSLLTVPLPPPQPGEMASRDRHNAPLVALGAGAP